MSQTPSTLQTDDHDELLRFPVRRDGWDTVDFYLPLLFGYQIIGLHMATMGINALHRTPLQPMGLVTLLVGAVQIVTGTIMAGLRTWRRFAERYELTESEFALHLGYCRKRAPYREISGLHPIKICRSTTVLKPAVRIKFRKPIPPPRSEHGAGFNDYDILGYKWSQPIAEAWSIDVCPVNLDGFLDELAARCPHLERDGQRFHPKAAGDKDANKA